MARKFFLILYLALSLVSSATLAWAAENPASATAQQPLTLQKCLELAYANNQALKAATKGIAVAQADLDKAKGAFIPTLGYEFNYNQSDEERYSSSNKQFSGGVAASYPIYTGGQLQNAYKSAQFQLELAKEKERSARQDLTFNVKSAYHQVWLAEENLLVAKASYENLARHAERIEKLFNVGNTSKFELLRAQVNRDNQKPPLIKAQNGVEIAKLALTTLIGLPKENTIVLDFKPDQVKLRELADNKLETVLATAYANRSDLKQLQLNAALTETKVALAKANLKPNVSLNGGYQGSGDELGPDSWNKYWLLTLKVQGNLYKCTTKPEIGAAKSEVEVIKFQANSLKDSIRQEVDQVLHNIKEHYETAKATEASIVLAKESLRLTEVRFQAGMATTMDVMDSQLALDKTLTGYYSSLAEYLTALAKLELVTGQN
jgi:outer membrane protein